LKSYSKKSIKTNNYTQLVKYERAQAKLFWKHLKPLVQRMGIPFERRITKQSDLEEIDLLNYRLNTVGNILRTQTLTHFGKGTIYFANFQTHHGPIPVLDATETVRPLLHYIAIQSISAPFWEVNKLVKEIIATGILWTQTWIASMGSPVKKPKNLNFTSLLSHIQNWLKAEKIIPRKPYQQQTASGSQPKPGMWRLSLQNKALGGGRHNQCC